MKPERALGRRVERIEKYLDTLTRHVRELDGRAKRTDGKLGTLHRSLPESRKQVGDSASRLKDVTEAMNKVLTRVVLQKRQGVGLLQGIMKFRPLLLEFSCKTPRQEEMLELLACIEQYVSEES